MITHKYCRVVKRKPTKERKKHDDCASKRNCIGDMYVNLYMRIVLV